MTILLTELADLRCHWERFRDETPPRRYNRCLSSELKTE